MKDKIITGKNIDLIGAQTELAKIAGLLRGRNRGAFFLQLVFGLWLAAAKIAAIKCDFGQTGNKSKGDPVAALFKYLGSKYSCLPKRRRLDQWAEATLAALTAHKTIRLPKRIGNEKQPKPQDLTQLRRVGGKNLRKIVRDYENMTTLWETFCSGRPDRKNGESPNNLVQNAVSTNAVLANTLKFLSRNPLLAESDLEIVRGIVAAGTALLNAIPPKSPANTVTPNISASLDFASRPMAATSNGVAVEGLERLATIAPVAPTIPQSFPALAPAATPLPLSGVANRKPKGKRNGRRKEVLAEQFLLPIIITQ